MKMLHASLKKTFIRNTFFVFMLLTSLTIAVTPDKDIANAKDHPFLTRLPGYLITKYTETQFDFFEFPVYRLWSRPLCSRSY